MGKTLTYIIIVISACFVFSCSTAKKAHQVDAVYIPSSQYENKSCDEILLLAEEIKQKTPSLERIVNETRRKDKVKEQVGLWLFFPTYFFMEGNAEEQTDLALARGNLNALRNVGIQKRCDSRYRNQNNYVEPYQNNYVEPSDIEKKPTSNRPELMGKSELNNYLEQIYKAKVDQEALDQVRKLYDRGVISKSVYEAETKKILEQTDEVMLDELQELLNKGLISRSSYNREKNKILIKSE